MFMLYCIAFSLLVSIYFFIPSGQLLMHSGMVVGSINYFFLFSFFHFSCLVACFNSRLSTNITSSVIVFNLTLQLKENIIIIATAYFVNCTYVHTSIFPVLFFSQLPLVLTVQWKIYSESIFAIRQDFYDPGNTLNKLCFKIYRQI